jgi:hypothetical protein
MYIDCIDVECDGARLRAHETNNNKKRFTSGGEIT